LHQKSGLDPKGSSSISLPGVPEGVDWKDYEGWTVGVVRAGVEAIAQATDEDPEKLLKYATDGAKNANLPPDTNGPRLYDLGPR
jgi:hypothetical protein